MDILYLRTVPSSSPWKHSLSTRRYQSTAASRMTGTPSSVTDVLPAASSRPFHVEKIMEVRRLSWLRRYQLLPFSRFN